MALLLGFQFPHVCLETLFSNAKPPKNRNTENKTTLALIEPDRNEY